MNAKAPAVTAEAALNAIDCWQRRLLEAQKEAKLCEHMIKRANEWITLQATGKHKDNT